MQTVNDTSREGMAPRLPEPLPSAALDGGPEPQRDSPLSPAAVQLFAEAPAANFAAQEDDDAFSIPAIKAAVARLKKPTVGDLANLFHQTRLAANYDIATAEDAEAEAERIHPAAPHAICPATGKIEHPAATWSQSRTAAHEADFALWNRQVELIDKALGLDKVRDAEEEALRLRQDLVDTICELPAASIEDASAKLGVIAWALDLDLVEGDKAAKLLFSLSSEFGRLLKPEADRRV